MADTAGEQPGAALVTGAGTRLGSYFALTLAERGYDVAVHYNSSRQSAQEVCTRIRALGRRCELFPFDFSSEQDPQALIDAAAGAFGSLEVLINSASAYDAATTAQTDRQLLQRQFSINFFTPYLLSRAFAARFDRGSIVNVIDNKIAYQQYVYSAYLLSKKTLAEFTRLAAVEFAPRFRVNGIAPGVVLPAEVRTDDYIQWREQGIPLARRGRVDELGAALCYLLDNEFVTGQILYVDGGESVNLVGRNAENYPGNKT